MLNSPNSQISIHAPRVGSDVVETRKPKPTQKFLSTLPAWGATAIDKWGKNDFCNFYPRSPRGERQQTKALKVAALSISIHAPRVGSDRTQSASQSAK